MFSNVQLWMLVAISFLVVGYFWYVQYLRNLERHAFEYVRASALNLITAAQQQPLDAGAIEPQMQKNKMSTLEAERLRTLRMSWENRKWWILGTAGILFILIAYSK
jgi:hypothetical protein